MSPTHTIVTEIELPERRPVKGDEIQATSAGDVLHVRAVSRPPSIEPAPAPAPAVSPEQDVPEGGYGWVVVLSCSVLTYVRAVALSK